MNLTAPATREEALSFLIEAQSSPMLAIDTETNGKDVRDSRGLLYGISIAYETPTNELISFYMPFRHPFSVNYNLNLAEFQPILQKLFDAKPIIFHHYRHDAFSLATAGIDVWNHTKVFDTLIICHEVDENDFDYALEAQARKWLDQDGKKNQKDSPLALFINAFGWEQVPALMIAEYAGWDANLTYRLFKKVWPLYHRAGGKDLWPHKLEVMKMLGVMERQGINIDVDLCDEMAVKGEHEMKLIQEKLGGRNPASPNDLKILLLDDLQLEPQYSKKTGRLTFDKDAMEIYDALLEESKNPLAQLVISYRGWQKSVSANYIPYVARLSPDGMLRCNYKLHGTKTGRLACEKPNLQQIPKSSVKPWNGRMKDCFIATSPDRVLIEPDMKQLEFRLATTYARDPALIKIFESGIDVFDQMSGQLGMERFEVKTLSYLIQYGGGVPRIMHVFGIGESFAKRIQSNFFDTYPGLRNQRQKSKNIAAVRGYVKTWSGRHQHFRFPSEHHKAFNKVIQGGAADIVERCMLRIRDAGMLDGDTQCRLQVHDSLALEVPRANAIEIAHEVRSIMSAVEPNWGIKFDADVHYWGGEKIL